MKSPEHCGEIVKAGDSCVPFNAHLSTRADGQALSMNISSAAVMNTLQAPERFARIFDVGTELPLAQIKIWPLSRFGMIIVLFLLMKMARGDEPTIAEVAKVVPFGFQDALGQNRGWLKGNAKVQENALDRLWISEENHLRERES